VPILAAKWAPTTDTVGRVRAQERVVQAGEVRLARVESLRALAALCVMTGHLWGSTHGYDPSGTYGSFWRRALFGGGFGVFVFYALSGYLLFWPFVRRHFGNGRPIDLQRYAANRALRILPLYFFAVVVLLVVQNHGGTFDLWWRHLALVQSMWTSSLNAVDGSLWSVAVEIQFYALLPLIAVALAFASGRSRVRAAAILVAVGAASYVARRELSPNEGDLWSYQLPTTFLFFVGGMLVALLRHAWEERRPVILDGPLGSSTLWALAAVPLFGVVFWRYDTQELCAVAAFLLLGALVLPLRAGPVVRALEWRPLALLGVASYSLYVWHVPIIDALGGGAGLLRSASFVTVLVLFGGVCIAAAFGSYRLIETPGLRLRRRWAGGAAEHMADHRTAGVDAAPVGSPT
jgi:peptidoglycan/LPS O-acetylase OafA/YrhL